MRRRSLAFDLLIGAAALAVLALLPLVFPSKALVDFMIRGSALALFATSLNFLVGYGGMVSFGHGMFFGLGAYSFALLMQRTGMPIPAAFALALAMCAALGLVVGAICVRLKEIYFAFLTLAFRLAAPPQSRMSRSSLRRGRSRRSSGRTAPARPRSSTLFPGRSGPIRVA
jgi:branched-chain amino acid transport system permease protein